MVTEVPRQRATRRLTWFLATLFGSIAFLSLFFMLVERHFIYFPDAYPNGRYLAASRAPFVEDIWFQSADGVRLHAWFIRADSAVATVILSHGNAGNLSYGFDLAERLRENHFSVFAYDYRGYGRSDGTPSEEGLYKDAEAAYDCVTRTTGTDSSRIVLWGFSLGSAVTIEIARHRPAAGIILESAFTSMTDLGRLHYPYLPVSLLLRSRFNSVDKISTLRPPILFIHGTNDNIVPVSQGRRLFDAATSRKDFLEIAGAGHNDLFQVGGEAYIAKIRAFISSVVSR